MYVEEEEVDVHERFAPAGRFVYQASRPSQCVHTSGARAVGQGAPVPPQAGGRAPDLGTHGPGSCCAPRVAAKKITERFPFFEILVNMHLVTLSVQFWLLGVSPRIWHYGKAMKRRSV